jgi:hypothetical protein
LAVVLPLALVDFPVTDTNGREYKVVLGTAESTRVAAGEEAVVSVCANGSPHWWTIKSMMLTISKKSGSDRHIVLTRALSTAKIKDIDSF